MKIQIQGTVVDFKLGNVPDFPAHVRKYILVAF